VESVWLYSKDHSVFATYHSKSDANHQEPFPERTGHWRDHNQMHILHPVRLDEEILGYLLIEYHINTILERLPQYVLVLSTVALAILLLGVLLMRSLQQYVTSPLLQLTGAATAVTRDGDYSIRTTPVGKDEIGDLSIAFNQMLNAAQEREQDLATREREYRRVVENMRDGITILDTNGHFSYVNEAFVKMLGYERKELLGITPYDLLDDPNQETLHMQDDAQQRDGHNSFELTWRHKAGGDVTTLISGQLIANEGGAPDGSFNVLTDITESRQLALQLRHAQKMEAIGRLAGGIAHDFNNILCIMNGFAEIGLEKIGNEEFPKNELEEISHAGERAAKLIRQLMAFSRKQVLEMHVIDLNEIVLNTRAIFERLLGETNHLNISVPKSPVHIEADPNQIEQVLINLAINARDAMPKGGTLDISVQASATPAGSSQDCAALTVRDTGCGISETLQGKIFDPFFTTKELGKGTGLGLSTISGIIDQHGGWITVDSTIGKGSTFTVFLPHSTKPILETPLTEPSTPSGESKTILVVEDEDIVRKCTVTMLKAEGHTVLEACDGMSALQLAADYKEQISLLLTDVMMPGMTGDELWRKFAGQHPKTRVLFMSGYAHSVIAETGALAPGAQLLNKPFTRAELLNKVNSTLKRSPASPEIEA
jgi:two-component system cell cycle sensor histidine kinase/response regulator CckA